MPKILYIGPFDEVDVPAYRLRAQPGTPVDVSDEAAEALLAQADNWKTAGGSTGSTSSTPAAKATPTNAQADAPASTPQEG